MPYSTMSFRMTLNDLAKYSITRNIARSFCDRWASCLCEKVGSFENSRLLVGCEMNRVLLLTLTFITNTKQ